MKKAAIFLIVLLIIGVIIFFAYQIGLLNFDFQFGKKDNEPKPEPKPAAEETSPHEHTVEWETTEPTCVNPGERRSWCTTCGETLTVEKLDMLEHDWDDGVVSWEPTDTTPGEMEYTCQRCGETRYERFYPHKDEEHEHIGYEWEIIEFPTCTEPGEKALLCGICGEPMEYGIVDPRGHDWGDGEVTTEPTETETGIRTYTCNECGITKTEVIPVIDGGNHGGNPGVVVGDLFVYKRIDADGNEDANGNYILFGSYPQSEVTDEALIDALCNAAVMVPIPGNDYGWTSYRYYDNGVASDYMWYKDIVLNGVKYRGVYFDKYRPYYTADKTASTDGGFSHQDENGYESYGLYWFRFEALKWRILSESDGTALLLCDNVIDGQQYYRNTGKRDEIMPANYAESDIRAWLNDLFYETAFNSLQQELITLTTVDNSARSTNPQNNATALNHGENTNACENTEDKVFLLSLQEVTNADYGFNTGNGKTDPARQMRASDYAKAQGTFVNLDTDEPEYTGNGWWWLRSPTYGMGYNIYSMKQQGNGTTQSITMVSGVVPALRIQIEE